MQTLRAFEAAVRHHSYSAAARELGVTHGAISHRVRTLEAQLNTILFQRSGREMVPTREAIALAAQVNEGLQILSQAMPAGGTDRAGNLVVGVHHSLAMSWLIPRLQDFIGGNPGISVEIYSTAELGDFINPNVHVAIRYGAGSWSRVSQERLAGDRLYPVCSPSYRDRQCIADPADLAGCRLLRHSWHTWIPWFRAAGLSLEEPGTGLLLSDSGMLLEAAKAGLGVALVGSVFAQAALEEGLLVKPFETSIPDSHAYYLLWNAGTRLAPQARLFRDWLHGQLAAASA
jgi:LysR family glycine cleavage system transcriptional activator